jgi:hypothetical protein
LIYWNDESGEGKVSAFVVSTDSAGTASVLVTLRSTPGPMYVRAALTDGTARIGEVIFVVTAVP